jgi:CTP synthase
LFVSFVGAALEYKAAERLPVEIPERRPNGTEHPSGVRGLLQEPVARG